MRADVIWLPSNDVTVRLIGDYNKINEVCCGVVQLQNGPATQFIGAAKPNGLGGLVVDPAARFDDKISFNTDPSNRLTGKGLSVQADWRSPIGTFTSITAQRTGCSVPSSKKRSSAAIPTSALARRCAVLAMLSAAKSLQLC